MTPTPTLSTNVATRHVKHLFWGPTGSRKTETALRLYPHVLLIDTEGNGDQCIGVPEIAPFLLLTTKDVNEVIDALDDVASGKLKFPDGSPVETVVIDSTTVLWSVRQEVGSLAAEQRAAKWNKSADQANMTQLDWVLAKRPLKRLNTRLNNSPIKFIIFTAREKDLYQQKEGGKKDELVKVGVTPDVIKGTEYEVNVALHFGFDPAGAWQCTVDKVQGALGKTLPKGKTLKKYPIKEILDFAAGVQVAVGDQKGEMEAAEASLKKEIAEEKPKMQPTKAAFLEEAVRMGYATPDGKPDAVAIKNALVKAELYPYEPAHHVAALKAL